MFSGTETQHIDDALLQERLFAKLTGFFGLAAMPLACVRLYGILSYAVLRRTSEIAIRMPAFFAWCCASLLLVLCGVVMGIAASYAATRLASSLISDLLCLLSKLPTSPLSFLRP